MLKSYFKIAYRSLLKNKSYVMINTMGLGVALACCITAYLLLAYNIEFDNFHKDGKVSSIFKIHTLIKEKDGKTTQRITAPMPMGPAIAEELSGIEKFTRYIYNGGYMRYGDTSFGEGLAFADSTFFEMFDFPLISGSTHNFKDKYSVFLNKEMATKYFAKEDPIGKTMILNFPNEKEISVTVGGVLAKIPDNNSFTFNALLRIEHYIDIHALKPEGWENWQQPSTFVSLTSPGQADQINKQFTPYVKLSNEKKPDMVVEQYRLEHFKAAGFNQDNINSSYVSLRISKIPLIVFSSMAMLILLIACFNLTNTSIAMTTKRLKEVGVRKTVGAARSQIISQFLFETIITIVLALMTGVLMAQLIVPAFTEMWQITYGMRDLSGLNLFITLVLLVFLTALLAGIYPALFNSKFKPVALLKGAVSINGTNGLTRSLVSVQFALSIIMLIAGVVFIQNTKFQENINFGYDKDMVVTVGVQSEAEFKNMKDRISANPKIKNISVSDHQVGWSTYTSPVKVDTAEYESRHSGVGKYYFETMGFKLAEGRVFDPENATEIEEMVMVNKAFLKKAGIEKNPIDKVIEVHSKKRRICGVLENHIENLHNSKEPEPFVFYPSIPTAYKMLLVRVEPSDRAEIQKYLEKNWKELHPTKPFDSHFQDDILLQGSKKTNSNLKTIFLFLTFLGGLLSACGIFSLASLNVARRTKEIGIRKALGATANHIVALINKEFVIILVIAMALGAAGGYYATDWLLSEIYAYHVAVGAIPVVACALSIFFIGISATSTTILKAAKTNPVNTLRNE
jgi:putative ABC transport system permease protein